MDNADTVKKRFTKPGKTKQINGSIISPENSGLRFILSVCSQSGKFETDLQKLLTKKWLKVREDYKGWYASRQNFKLGCVNTTAVNSDIWVINVLVNDDKEILNSEALDKSIKKVSDMAKYEKASLHVSNLLVSAIPELSELLEKHFIQEGMSVYFYSN